MKALKIILLLALMAYAWNMPAQTVYVTKTGEKHHKGSCHFLKNSKKDITLETALERGFTACSVCKPTRGGGTSTSTTTVNSFTSPSTSTAPKVTATQCAGKTKA